MEIVSLVLAVWSIFILNSLDGVYSINAEVDALIAFNNNFKTESQDPNNVLQSWDPSSLNPCTCFHVTCDITNSVTKVDLGNCNLSGRLDSSLSQLTNLETLNLYENNIYGSIPVSLAKLQKLINLNLHSNSLSGVIPEEFGSLSNLKILDLSVNGLMGEIPIQLAQCQQLQVIQLSDNTFQGHVVDGFGSLKGLMDLNLSSNNIDGTLPDWTALDKMPNLKIIDLRDNKLSGYVPKSWINNIINNPNIFVDLRSNSFQSGQPCTDNPCGNPPQN